jgi:hypothetical protein
MSAYQLLKTASAEVSKLADALEAAHKDLASAKETVKVAEAKAEQTKTASVKVAEDQKAAKAKLAKTAADKLLDAGLLSSTEKRDQFAAQILDHNVALTKIAELAKFAQAPKVGTVVVDDTAKASNSADEVWAKKVAEVNARLNSTR